MKEKGKSLQEQVEKDLKQFLRIDSSAQKQLDILKANFETNPKVDRAAYAARLSSLNKVLHSIDHFLDHLSSDNSGFSQEELENAALLANQALETLQQKVNEFQATTRVEQSISSKNQMRFLKRYTYLDDKLGAIVGLISKTNSTFDVSENLNDETEQSETEHVDIQPAMDEVVLNQLLSKKVEFDEIKEYARKAKKDTSTEEDFLNIIEIMDIIDRNKENEVVLDKCATYLNLIAAELRDYVKFSQEEKEYIEPLQQMIRATLIANNLKEISPESQKIAQQQTESQKAREQLQKARQEEVKSYKLKSEPKEPPKPMHTLEERINVLPDLGNTKEKFKEAKAKIDTKTSIIKIDRLLNADIQRKISAATSALNHDDLTEESHGRIMKYFDDLEKQLKELAEDESNPKIKEFLEEKLEDFNITRDLYKSVEAIKEIKESIANISLEEGVITDKKPDPVHLPKVREAVEQIHEQLKSVDANNTIVVLENVLRIHYQPDDPNYEKLSAYLARLESGVAQLSTDQKNDTQEQRGKKSFEKNKNLMLAQIQMTKDIIRASKVTIPVGFNSLLNKTPDIIDELERMSHPDYPIREASKKHLEEAKAHRDSIQLDDQQIDLVSGEYEGLFNQLGDAINAVEEKVQSVPEAPEPSQLKDPEPPAPVEAASVVPDIPVPEPSLEEFTASENDTPEAVNDILNELFDVEGLDDEALDQEFEELKRAAEIRRAEKPARESEMLAEAPIASEEPEAPQENTDTSLPAISPEVLAKGLGNIYLSLYDSALDDKDIGRMLENIENLGQIFEKIQNHERKSEIPANIFEDIESTIKLKELLTLMKGIQERLPTEVKKANEIIASGDNEALKSQDKIIKLWKQEIIKAYDQFKDTKLNAQEKELITEILDNFARLEEKTSKKITPARQMARKATIATEKRAKKQQERNSQKVEIVSKKAPLEPETVKSEKAQPAAPPEVLEPEPTVEAAESLHAEDIQAKTQSNIKQLNRVIDEAQEYIGRDISEFTKEDLELQRYHLNHHQEFIQKYREGIPDENMSEELKEKHEQCVEALKNDLRMIAEMLPEAAPTPLSFDNHVAMALFRDTLDIRLSGGNPSYNLAEATGLDKFAQKLTSDTPLTVEELKTFRRNLTEFGSQVGKLMTEIERREDSRYSNLNESDQQRLSQAVDYLIRFTKDLCMVCSSKIDVIERVEVSIPLENVSRTEVLNTQPILTTLFSHARGFATPDLESEIFQKLHQENTFGIPKHVDECLKIENKDDRIDKSIQLLNHLSEFEQRIAVWDDITQWKVPETLNSRISLKDQIRQQRDQRINHYKENETDPYFRGFIDQYIKYSDSQKLGLKLIIHYEKLKIEDSFNLTAQFVEQPNKYKVQKHIKIKQKVQNAKNLVQSPESDRLKTLLAKFDPNEHSKEQEKIKRKLAKHLGVRGRNSELKRKVYAHQVMKSSPQKFSNYAYKVDQYWNTLKTELTEILRDEALTDDQKAVLQSVFESEMSHAKKIDQECKKGFSGISMKQRARRVAKLAGTRPMRFASRKFQASVEKLRTEDKELHEKLYGKPATDQITHEPAQVEPTVPKDPGDDHKILNDKFKQLKESNPKLFKDYLKALSIKAKQDSPTSMKLTDDQEQFIKRLPDLTSQVIDHLGNDLANLSDFELEAAHAISQTFAGDDQDIFEFVNEATQQDKSFHFPGTEMFNMDPIMHVLAEAMKLRKSQDAKNALTNDMLSSEDLNADFPKAIKNSIVTFRSDVVPLLDKHHQLGKKMQGAGPLQKASIMKKMVKIQETVQEKLGLSQYNNLLRHEVDMNISLGNTDKLQTLSQKATQYSEHLESLGENLVASNVGLNEEQAQSLRLIMYATKVTAKHTAQTAEKDVTTKRKVNPKRMARLKQDAREAKRAVAKEKRAEEDDTLKEDKEPPVATA